METEYIIEMKDVSKSFPGVQALSSINLNVRRGEIHAICGENGAGKSTLIKILAGVHTKGSYKGDILVDGERVAFAGTGDAEHHGIICIHQELELIPELSVGENIFLGNYPVRNGLIQWNQIHYDAKSLLERAGLEGRDLAALSEEKIINLGIGQQQLVEIAKAFARNARVLVLDEPTAALTVAEADNLLKIVTGMKARGVTCIYISHRLDEVMKIADTITILRDGQWVGTEARANLTKNDIIAKMVGRQLTNLFPTEEHEQGDVVLEVEHFSVTDPETSREVVSDVSFEAYRGEILGIAGLMGAGRSELFTSLFGAYGHHVGKIRIEGKPISVSNPANSVKNGLFLLPEDRKRNGLVAGMDVKSNTVLASLDQVSRLGVIDDNAEVFETSKLVERLRTKVSSVEMVARNLSGGNQQKVVLQKALMTKPKLLILDEPTRGIDVGAKYEIYKIMNKLVDEGVAVIMISSELEEILGMSDASSS